MRPKVAREERTTAVVVNPDHSVLLLGATGRTGGRVLTQLLERGVSVRAIVRSGSRLPAGASDDPLLSVIEAEVLSLTPEELKGHLEGCDTVISCLGHNITFKGLFGPPFSIAARAASDIVRAVETMRPAEQMRFILMSTVAANLPGRTEAARGAGQRLYLWVIRLLVPPARDNQRAVDFFADAIGPRHPRIEWVAVRPDTLLDGPITEYRLHDELVGSIFKPDETNMANVAHFMCELVCDDDTWRRWSGRMPVIVNAGTTA